MPLVRLLPFCLICACAPFPQIETGSGAGLGNEPFPTLVPIEQVLGAAPDTRAPDNSDLDARIAALRARAGALRGPVIDTATQTRMTPPVAQ